MDSKTVAILIDNGIPIVGGILATLIGFRVIGKKPGADEKYDKQMEKLGPLLTILGPLLVLYGIVMLLIKLGR